MLETTPDLETSLGLVEVSQGKRPADLYISGGLVLNVYSGEVIPANIAVYRGRIAYVGMQRTMIGTDTEVLDASGWRLAPGYVNGHDHGDVLSTPTTHTMEALRRGTTTMLYNCRHIPFMTGPTEYRQFLDEMSDLPLKVYFGVETVEGAYRLTANTSEDFETVSELLSSNRIFGLHEVVRWTDVLAGDESLIRKIAMARQAGKTVEGHTAGATYDKLNVMAAAGIQTCHEAINLQDTLNRLRLGMYVMLRCSSIRPDDLGDMLRAVTEIGVNTSRLILVPDGMVPADGVRKGNMDYLVARALEAGVEPVTAYQMATINPATHFGIDGDIGGIAPRRWADILFLKDLRQPTPDHVMSNGAMVVRDGQLQADFPEPTYYSLIRNKFATPDSPPAFSAQTFLTPSLDGKPFPIVEMVSNVINRRLDVDLPVEDGLVRCPPHEDIQHLALVTSAAGTITRGFVKGFGARVGGLAATADGSSEMVVIGSDPAQMASAASRVWELQGGVVLWDQGERVFELPLPIGGVMSPLPLPALAVRLQEIARLLREKGFPYEDLHYSMGTLTWYFLPQLRLTAEGVLDIKLGKIVVPSAPLWG